MAESGRDTPGPSRDAPTTPSRLPVPEPDDVGLPRAKPSFVLPALIALAVFALVIGARLIWQWQAGT